MSKIILSINSGSSSVKISVYETSSKSEIKQLAETQIDGLTSPPQKLKYKRGSTIVAKGKELSENISTQDDAFKYMLDELVNDKELNEIQRKDDIAIACHRVVHGGDYTEPQVINSDTMHRLATLTDLAPLHNGPALQIIKSCLSTLPKAKNIAYFDSQFHQSIPEHIRTYPIDQEIAKNNGLREIRKAEGETNIIACHLGSGASVCAVRGGKSIDTSMGLTPLSGLPGATRSGNVDPCLVFHYASNTGNLSPHSTSDLHITQAEEILNKSSGWKALTGTTDFGAITSAAFSNSSKSSEDKIDSKAARLAFDLFVNRIANFIGSYYVLLHGNVDALVFAGGIGEKGWQLREAVTKEVDCLGFKMGGTSDQEKSNQTGGNGKNSSQNVDGDKNKDEVVVDVGEEGSRHRVLVVRTDEQFEMVRGTTESGIAEA